MVKTRAERAINVQGKDRLWSREWGAFGAEDGEAQDCLQNAVTHSCLLQ